MPHYRPFVKSIAGFCLGALILLSLAKTSCGAETIQQDRQLTSVPNGKQASDSENQPLSFPANPLRVVFFFSPGCRMCAEAKAAIKEAESTFGNTIAVERVDLSAGGVAAFNRLCELLNHHGVDEEVTPSLSVFCGNSHVLGGEDIVANLQTVLRAELAGATAANSALNIDRLSLLAIGAAALADGINPCAFSTMVLLVSMLAAAGKNRREVAVIGGAFTFAVFATYLLIGIFFYQVMNKLQTSPSLLALSDAIYWLAFLLCCICGILSLYDSVVTWRSKNPQAILLKLPDSLRDRMRKSLRQGVHASSVFWGALVTGVTVAFLESACTGQVYFPVISKLVKDSETFARGLTLLLYYNLLFTLPLLAMFGLTLGGVESERIARIGRKHLPLAKLLLATVFAAMALWLSHGLAWPLGAR